MKYFNKNFLITILNRYGPFTIFANSEHLNITDAADIRDGVGYSMNGGDPRRFKDLDIKEIMVGSTIYTLDMLNPESKSEEEPDKGKESKGEEKESTTAEEKPEPKKREESIYSGSKVTILSESYGILKGIVKNVFPDGIIEVNVYNTGIQNFEKFVVSRKEIISVD